MECTDVIWVQVGPWFADVRVPRPGQHPRHAFDEAHAFSGTLEIVSGGADGAEVAWHHDLDTVVHEDDHEPDAAAVMVRDGVLIEAGQGYVEWWSPPDLTTADAPRLVLARTDGQLSARVVCADNMAVGVWSNAGQCGGAWSCAEGAWEPARVVGPLPADLGMASALQAALSGAPLPSPWVAL